MSKRIISCLLFAVFISCFSTALSAQTLDPNPEGNCDDDAEIAWELRYPFRQFSRYSEGQKLIFMSPRSENLNDDWKFRRDLYVDQSCLEAEDPILCSEEKIGPNRMQTMLNNVRSPDQPSKDHKNFELIRDYHTYYYGYEKNNTWLAKIYLRAGNQFSRLNRAYQQRYIREHFQQNARSRARIWLDVPEYKDHNCIFQTSATEDQTFLSNCEEGLKLGLSPKEETQITIKVLENPEEGVENDADAKPEVIGEYCRKSGTKVEQVLIVALGDSYASGEGVPDIPAQVIIQKNPYSPLTWQEKLFDHTESQLKAKMASENPDSEPPSINEIKQAVAEKTAEIQNFCNKSDRNCLKRLRALVREICDRNLLCQIDAFTSPMKKESLVAHRLPAYVRGKINPYLNSAEWIDRTCHRSLMSAQGRAAIHFAATHPQTETIFLHFACSGAKARTGLMGTYSGFPEADNLNQKANNPSVDKIRQYSLSQINEVIRALCKTPDMEAYNEGFTEYYKYRNIWQFYQENGELPREPLEEINARYDAPPSEIAQPYYGVIDCPDGFVKDIDMLLLSIGGNDTGFFPVVLNQTMSTTEKLGAVLARADGGLSPSAARKIADEKIEVLYNELAEHFHQDLNLAPPQEQDNVIILTYPLPLMDKDKSGKEIYCSMTSGLEKMDIVRVSRPKLTAKESQDIVETYGGPLNELIKTHASAQGWKVADSHRDKFIGHSICSQSVNDPMLEEIFGYAQFQRWLRTPNDGYLTQHLIPSKAERERGYFKNSLYGAAGAFHPNYQGAAAMADAYLIKMNELAETSEH